MKYRLAAGVLVALAAAPVHAQTWPVSPTLKGTKVPSGSGFIMYYSIGAATAPPLVLISGGPGFDATYFRLSPTWGLIAQGAHRRIVFYDQKGTGKASPVGPTDTVTIAGSVADLEALRLALGAQKLDLIGHSFGGYLAMAYGAAHGDRVSHMILMGSAAPKFSETIFLFDKVFPETGGNEKLGGALASGNTSEMEAATTQYLRMIFWSPENRDRFLKALGHTGFNIHQFAHLSKDMGATDLTAAIGRFTFPTLVVSGRYDMNVAPLTGFRIHQAIPGSKFAIMERSSHMMFYEEPGQYAKVVSSFLNER
ncbi:MAG: alpha/beta hydrolase [Gemmatimonadota bacterium]